MSDLNSWEMIYKDDSTSPAWKTGIIQEIIGSILPCVTIGFENADYICDGIADNVQIQEAIDDVTANGGGQIYFKPGNYALAAGIVFAKNPYLRLTGSELVKGSTGGTRLSASASMTNMFSMSGDTNPVNNASLAHQIMFDHMTINGAGLVTNLFYLSNVDYAVFDDCRLVGATNSIKTVWDSVSTPVASTIPGGIRVNDCIVSAGTGGIAIDLQNQTQCWIHDTWFDGGGGSTAWINFFSCNKIKVTACEFNSSATSSLVFGDDALTSCHDITVTGCTFVGTKGWTDNRTNASSNRVAIVGNTMLSSDTADNLVGSGNVVLNGRPYTQPTTTVTTATTPTPSSVTTTNYTITALASAAAFGAPTGTPLNGQTLIIRIKDNGTARALSWNAIYRAIGLNLPTTTVISKTLYVGCIYNSTDTKWDVVAVAQEA